MKISQRLFLSNEYFTIALRFKNDPYKDQKWRFFLNANKNRWFADPMIAVHNGKSYLFYEATEGMHGHIEVAEILDDCSLGECRVILSDNYHYSYPFVFCYNDEWYMIPESSDRSKVCLYKAVDFPYDWENVSVLLNEKAVDTTVFEFNGKYFMLTYMINGVNEIVIPKAYELDLENRRITRELKWEEPNGLCTRGAGPLYYIENRLYRPAQMNREHRYGDGIVIYEINQCDSCFSETKISEMRSISSKLKGRVITGMHTYTVSSDYEAVDIRIRDIDVLKIPKKIVCLIKKRFKK